MKKIVLMLIVCFICSNVYAKNYDVCYKVFTGVNGKKYCNVHKVMNWFSAVAFCKANGFEIASINDLCDIDSEPANRFKGGWKFAQYDACPNTIGADVGSLSNYKWSSSPSDALGHMFARAGDGRVCDYQLSTREHAGPYGVICDTGEYGCPQTQPDNPATITTQQCCEYYKDANGLNVFSWDVATNTCRSRCYTTDNANAASSDTEGCQSNQDCCSSDDFCAYLNSDASSEDYSTADKIKEIKGPGTCVPITRYPSQTVIVSDKVFIRSDGLASEGMNWWSAQNWCVAKNLEPATRASIGCGSIVNDSTVCNSEYTTAWFLDNVWKGSNPDRKLWLDEAEGTNPRLGWTVRISKNVQKTASGQYHNRVARSDDRFALCVMNAPSCSAGSYFDRDTLSCSSCDANPGNPADVTKQECCEYYEYTWNETGVCTCPSKTIWDSEQNACIDACYTTNNANAPTGDTTGCQKNSDCCSSDDFCAFVTNATTTEHGKGTCVPIITYPKDPNTVVVDNKEFFRSQITSAGQINWWSARNWCAAQNAEPAERSMFTCNNGNCTNTLTTTITQTWHDEQKHWLERVDSTAGYAYVILFREDGSCGVSSSNKANKGTQLNYSASRYALCRGEQACNPTQPDDPSTITTQQCCEYYKDTNGNSIWAWDSVNNTCGCPDGGTWASEEKVCVPSDMCLYYLERPAAPTTIRHSYQDCSSGNCVNGSWSEVLPVTYRVIKDDCVWPQYCVLRYSDAQEATIEDSVTSGYIYGRCGTGF